jgi:hypothetical protein
MRHRYNEQAARADYEKLDQEELYEFAKTRGIEGLSNSIKPEIIDALVEADKAEYPPDPAGAIGQTGATGPTGLTGLERVFRDALFPRLIYDDGRTCERQDKS